MSVLVRLDGTAWAPPARRRLPGAFVAPATPDAVLCLGTHPSGFGAALVRRLQAMGVPVHVVDLCLGDRLFRLGLGGAAYRGRLDAFEDWLDAEVARLRVGTLLYYADQRLYHRLARRVARRRGIEAVAFEFGYLRPDWITLEKGGMGVFSHFPDDPALIRRLARTCPDPSPEPRLPYRFGHEAPRETLYDLSQALLPLAFPGYESDRHYPALLDYPSYLPKLFFSRTRARRAAATVERLAGHEAYFVVLMQMQGDYQVRRASGYGRLDAMIEEVTASFARHAPADCRLVFKLHPLENGLRDWPRAIRRAGARHGLGDRVDVLDGGDLARLLDGARGAVTLNSTAGLQALRQGVPVKVLGVAVYAMAGTTHQGPLDGFWGAPQKPCTETVAALVRLMRASIQIKGNFFTPEGRAAAVEGAAERLTTGGVNGFGAFVDPPPRLATARATGVPVVFGD